MIFSFPCKKLVSLALTLAISTIPVWASNPLEGAWITYGTDAQNNVTSVAICILSNDGTYRSLETSLPDIDRAIDEINSLPAGMGIDIKGTYTVVDDKLTLRPGTPEFPPQTLTFEVIEGATEHYSYLILKKDKRTTHYFKVMQPPAEN